MSLLRVGLLKFPHPWPYADFLRLQSALTQAVIEDSQKAFLLIGEHEPIYTLGRREHDQFDVLSKRLSCRIARVPRGGQCTWHGPGQLVVYPICNLKVLASEQSTGLLHWYSERLQTFLLQVFRSLSPQASALEAKSTGVWINGRKAGFVGYHLSRWVTSFGVSINYRASTEEWFKHIVPCGEPDMPIGFLDCEPFLLWIAIEKEFQATFNVNLFS